MACVVKTGPIEGTFQRLPDPVISHVSSYLNGLGVSRLSQLSRGFHHARPCLFANHADLISSLLIRRRHDTSLLTDPEKRALMLYGASLREVRFIDHYVEHLEDMPGFEDNDESSLEN